MKANRHLRFQKCLPTENSQSTIIVAQRRTVVNTEFRDPMDISFTDTEARNTRHGAEFGLSDKPTVADMMEKSTER